MGLIASALSILGIGKRAESRALPGASLYGDRAFSSFSDSQLRANSTVQACGNLLANSVSILPLNLYRKDRSTGARTKAGYHPVYQLLRRRPNATESPVVFLGKIMRDIIFKGGAYIWKDWIGNRLASLHVLAYDSVTAKRDGFRVEYWYNGENHTREIIYISSLITDPYSTGYSVVEFAKAAVELGLALDQFSLAAFQNGLNSKLFVDISEHLTAQKITDSNEAQKQARIIRDFLAAQYAGSGNAGKPIIGLNGLKLQELAKQNSFKEAELLESRKHQDSEIAKLFGVPLFLIDSNYDVKYGNRESALADFLNFGLMPYLLHIANRLEYALLGEAERDSFYLEFDFNVLNRPSAEARATIYGKLLDVGALSPNQIAASENLDSLGEVGDYHWMPANKMPLTPEVIDAYMAGAKLKAEQLGKGGGLNDPAAKDPARAAGDDKL